MAEAGGEVEVLYWVGCAGAYDARYNEVARAMVKVRNAAGVRFAILGTEEKCTGDPARRSGNEYLAQMLIAENVETLNKYKFHRIVASCPHCFNTLKNEYPEFGGNYQVVHHTVFLNELVDAGSLKVSREAQETRTFDDSCHIASHNGISHALMNVLTL